MCIMCIDDNTAADFLAVMENDNDLALFERVYEAEGGEITNINNDNKASVKAYIYMPNIIIHL